MKIEKYISELLYRYQCVGVPGFGAFLCEWQSAQVIVVQNSFVPPKKVISFNSHIKNNDGLLANHIALQEKISYENAVSKIQTQVVFWLEKLENKESLVLENIGEIFSNSEHNFVFKPNTAINYLTDSFGLAGFNSPEIARENQIQTEIVSEVAPQIETPVSVNTTEEAETPVIPLNGKNRTKTWMKYAAAVAIFASAGTYGYKMYFDYTIEQQTSIVEKTVQEKINQKLQEATFVIPNPINAVDLTLEQTHTEKYHVVAGAFRSKQNALKAMNDLVSKGFEAHLLTENKYGLIPVAFGSFSNLTEAQNLKIQIKAKDSVDAWLLID
ncbi:SPOR domain-containing protein [Flavobacterium sp.]|uniref:HU domain-containing protein n=1 Tax=Flavobacterium sp. TaxID=239 RepID=UPI001B70D553|nr:SPOR domain-containing protein [Flavobacterium sp.]MBP6128404.1 SPOR domain-containing protein [Flavobacterium sp.]